MEAGKRHLRLWKRVEYVIRSLFRGVGDVVHSGLIKIVLSDENSKFSNLNVFLYRGNNVSNQNFPVLWLIFQIFDEREFPKPRQTDRQTGILFGTIYGSTLISEQIYGQYTYARILEVQNLWTLVHLKPRTPPPF